MFGIVNTHPRCGSLAQLGEHLPYKQRVIGSSPITPTRKNTTTVVFFVLLCLQSKRMTLGMRCGSLQGSRGAVVLITPTRKNTTTVVFFLFTL